MAVWQFNLALIPKSWLDSGGKLKSLFGEESCDLSDAWSQFQPEGLRQRLNGVLPEATSWSAALTLWGHTEHDDISLWERNGRVESLSVRFDLRKPNWDLFASVVELAEDFQLAIIDIEHVRILENSMPRLSQAAALSNAARFVADPEAFLARLIDRDGHRRSS